LPTCAAHATLPTCAVRPTSHRRVADCGWMMGRHLVHFYFSQLTLNAVFVVDKGRFVGMINKVDMIKGVM
jgi:hypothetical protein